jgi:TolB-like protein
MEFIGGKMKKAKILGLMTISLLTSLTFSCVSLQDRTLSVMEKNETEILGTVKTEFVSFQLFHFQNKDGIKTKAYTKLLENARIQYGNDVDIKNITISGGFSGFEALNIAGALVVGIPVGMAIGNGIYLASGKPYAIENEIGGALGGMVIGVSVSGNTQKITATGDVVPSNLMGQQTRRRANRGATTGIEGALNRVCGDLVNELPNNSTIAVISISSNDRETSAFVVDEVEFQLVDAHKFTIVDRKTLDTIRFEQNFQMSGDVSDASAVSIGQMLGANIVITGSITGTGTMQRLSIKALDVRTAQIVTMVRESF